MLKTGKPSDPRAKPAISTSAVIAWAVTRPSARPGTPSRGSGPQPSEKAPEALYERGATEYVAGRHAAAVPLLRQAAAQGYADAQNALGNMHNHGEGGLPVDHAKALAWYRKAATEGHAQAQYNIGGMYSNGEGGLAQDEVQAPASEHAVPLQ